LHTGHDPAYIAYKGFISGLLTDWAVRTENPWEANLFYVPALTYAYRHVWPVVGFQGLGVGVRCVICDYSEGLGCDAQVRAVKSIPHRSAWCMH
jgi:hypothetical protein